MEGEQSTSPSLKTKLKQTLCLSCCLPANHPAGSLHSPSSSDERPRLLRASSAWLASRDHGFPEIKDKCRHIISRIGGHRRRHSSSADFKYDPLGYSLNFDSGGHVDEAPSRNFSTRSLPLTTVPEGYDPVKPAVTSEITCL
ncbi:hypothetical protein RHMOL_Rhmol03G0279500 [Rhododendron molle]|uniref:Uncharacterized protein n=1 Tax=Rhododendron molle TaxID=49168 RepID=A0ACC0PJP7_RHOML|nr:hypothetical protein RHMOL_Rhmol03G0279500 [Rhododendron molle]